MRARFCDSPQVRIVKRKRRPFRDDADRTIRLFVGHLAGKGKLKFIRIRVTRNEINIFLIYLQADGAFGKMHRPIGRITKA